MNTKFTYYILVVALTIFASCKQTVNDFYQIEGKITSLTDRKIYIIPIQTANELAVVDTVVCDKNGNFSYKGQTDSLSSVMIYMEKGKVWTTVWVENKEKITLSGDAVYPELILAKGGEINDQLSEFREKNHDLLKNRRDLIDRRDALEIKDSLTVEVIKESRYASKILNLNYTLKNNAENFIVKNPESIASLVLLQDFVITWGEPKEAKQYLDTIKGKAAETKLYKSLSTEVNDILKKLSKTELGAIAPDFSVVTVDKKDTLTLSSFKDKYLLLSFSATWCRFCRQSNKELVKIRNKVSEKQLAMLTIALDESVTTWQKIVKDEKMDWYQFVDTTVWNSSLVQLYNVTEIPANILIDKDKIIVSHDISADSLIVFLSVQNK